MFPRALLISFCAMLLLAAGCATTSRREATMSFENGQKLFRECEYEKAVAAFRQALAAEPTRAEIYPKLANALFECGKFDEAVAACNRALELNPELWDARRLLWRFQLVADDWSDEARARIKNEIDMTLARLERDGKINRESIRFIVSSYRLVHTKDSLDGIFDYKKYGAYLKKDTEDSASEDAFWKARLTSPHDKMIVAFEEYVAQFPNTPKWTDAAYRYILPHYADEKTRDVGKLRGYSEKWLRAMPDSLDAHSVTAKSFLKAEIDLDKAVAHAKRAVELFENPARKKKWLDAHPDQEVFNYERTLAGFYDLVGWAHFKKKERAQAHAWWNKALSTSAEVPDTFFHKGQLVDNLSASLPSAQAADCYARALMLANHRDAEAAWEAYVTRVFQVNLEMNPGANVLMTLDKTKTVLREMYWREHRTGVPTHFTDITVASGLVEKDGKPIRGNSVAWGDYDGDGYDDLLIGGNRLFRNKRDGTFEEVTEQAGLKGAGGGCGYWADYNNDGRLDFFIVCGSESASDQLWKNNGDGTFTNVTKEAGITDFISPKLPNKFAPGAAAAWADFDRDGFVDLYVANYERHGLPRARGTPDKLFRNKGDGTFEEVSTKVGARVPVPRCGRGVAWADFNNSGFPSLFVANYRLDPNFLFLNRGGTFTNEARLLGVEGKMSISGDATYFGHSIGCAWGDYNNDGWLDLFVGNLAHPRDIQISDKSGLYKNNGGAGVPPVNPTFRTGETPVPPFQNVRQIAGIKYEETHAQPLWFDFDNDGWLDLFITSIYEGRYSFLYRNKGDGTFEDVSWLAGVRAENGWGCAWSDFNRDGAPDLVVGSTSGLRLFKNNGNQHHWLQIKLVGNDCNRSAIGARVTIRCKQGIQIREIEGGSGTASQNSMVAHFGFGKEDAPVDVEIRWVCGKLQKLSAVKLNQYLVVREE